jgi:hypothetical protein
LKLVISTIFKTWWTKALVLENRREIMERKRKMQCTGAHGSNKKFRDGSSAQGHVFCSGQQRRDFKFLSERFSALISRLLAL